MAILFSWGRFSRAVGRMGSPDSHPTSCTPYPGSPAFPPLVSLSMCEAGEWCAAAVATTATLEAPRLAEAMLPVTLFPVPFITQQTRFLGQGVGGPKEKSPLLLPTSLLPHGVSSNPDTLPRVPSLSSWGFWESQVLGKCLPRLSLRTDHQNKDCLYLKETHGGPGFQAFYSVPLGRTQIDCSRTSVTKDRQL